MIGARGRGDLSDQTTTRAALKCIGHFSEEREYGLPEPLLAWNHVTLSSSMRSGATSGLTARQSYCETASRLIPPRWTRPWQRQCELPPELLRGVCESQTPAHEAFRVHDQRHHPRSWPLAAVAWARWARSTEPVQPLVSRRPLGFPTKRSGPSRISNTTKTPALEAAGRVGQCRCSKLWSEEECATVTRWRSRHRGSCPSTLTEQVEPISDPRRGASRCATGQHLLWEGPPRAWSVGQRGCYERENRARGGGR